MVTLENLKAGKVANLRRQERDLVVVKVQFLQHRQLHQFRRYSLQVSQ